MKGGIDWNLNFLGVDRDPWEFYLMFLSREIDKTVKFLRKSIYLFIKFGRTLMGLDQLLKSLGFSLYPLSFFLNSPYKETAVVVSRDSPDTVMSDSQ